MARSAVFLVHLLQDVHVLRPLIFMAAKDFGFTTKLLVSDRFRARDTSGIWLNEIQAICAESGAVHCSFADDWQARNHLDGQGLLFAASESHIENHAVAHNIFRHAPATFLKVTLQHGFECVGFRHGADHVRLYGDTASFAADLLCAWSGLQHLTALAPSQASKVVVTGPTSVLQIATGEVSVGARRGLLCENLHSVRFGRIDELEQEFLQTFRKFAGAMHRHGQRVGLRPHPGGQYFAKTKAALPRSVQLENAPLYRLDLRQFSYGVSPPSSVLIDMLLADIPTAVWRDRRGRIDTGNYVGLPTVSSAEEMISFADRAELHRDELVLAQRGWLEDQGILQEPAAVYARFAGLFEMAQRMEVRRPGSRAERARILLVTDGRSGLQPEVEEAFGSLGANGEVVSKVMDARALMSLERAQEEEGAATTGSASAALDEYDPSVIVVAERGLTAGEPILRWAKFRQVPVIYLLSLPAADLPADADSDADFQGVAGTSQLLQGADVIYVPTADQKLRLERAFPDLKTIVGPAEQASNKQRSAPMHREELLRIIALGHAAAAARAIQEQKETDVCHNL